MLILLIAFLLLAFYKAKITPIGFQDDYMSRDTTGAAKGIFAVVIVFSHIQQYIKLDNAWYDTPFNSFTTFLGQAMVSLFFFYSGYGIYEAMKKKPNYMDTFINNRVFKTLVNFDLAVLFYWFVVAVIQHKNVDFYLLVKALIGLESLGNSNWFIFTLILIYLFVFFCEKICKENHYISLPLITALIIGYIVFARKSGFAGWWYDTALCVPCGMIYSLTKDRLDSLMRKNIPYCTVTAIVVAIYILSTLLYKNKPDIVLDIFKNTIFVFAWTFLSMKIALKNKVLLWLGEHSFAIYIIQRIPMIIMKHYAPNLNRYLYCLITLPLVFITAYLFNLLIKYTDKLLFKPKTV